MHIIFFPLRSAAEAGRRTTRLLRIVDTIDQKKFPRKILRALLPADVLSHVLVKSVIGFHQIQQAFISRQP